MNTLARLWDSDVAYSFRTSPVAIVAFVVAVLLIFSATFAGWVAPHNPFDLATINLLDASKPPAWAAEGERKFIFGTDDQGRDVYSAILYGMRISLAIGVASVILSVILGVGLGLDGQARAQQQGQGGQAAAPFDGGAVWEGHRRKLLALAVLAPHDSAFPRGGRRA